MSQLLQNAVCGTAMILTVAVLRRVLKDRLAPGARLALWAVCLFRLLTPAAPESVLSLWRLGRWFAQETQDAPAPAPVVPVSNGAGAFVPAAPEMTAPAAPAPQPAPEIPWETILLALWAAVGVALAVRYVLSYARTRRAVGRTILLERDDPRYALLPRCARLREGVMEGAPLTFGAVRPTVVLSPGLAGEELVCVLAHEGVHARRRDNLWHYVTALALVVHWWNPAVWLMARLLRRDVELSCDRAVVKQLGADKRAAYANALLSMATQGKDPAFCQTFGRKATEERVISVMKYKKATIVGTALTLALVLAISVGFASNPAEPKSEPSAELGGSEQSDPVVTASVEPDEKTPVESAWPVSLDGYKALLDGLVADGKVSQEDADWLLSGAKQAIEQAEKDGWAAVIETNASGGYAIKTAPLCALTDCGNTGVHTHEGITYSGWMNERAIPPFCTDEACADFAPHWHENGERIHFYNTLPAKLPVCPVEGCTTPGGHTHDGSVYACSGAHSGGVCDGSCLVWFNDKNSQGNEVPAGGQGEICTLPLAPSGEPIACPPETIDKSIWPVNSKGQTYGNNEIIDGKHPDLVVCWEDLTNGQLCYVLYDEYEHGGYGPVNNPEEAMGYMAWLATQPAETVIPVYDSEGNVIGDLRMSNPLADPDLQIPQLESCPVCAVEGCAIEGRHEHAGMTYCGGAGHRGDTCNGSCLYCTQQAVADGHHSESHSSGHHSESHHNNGHH